MRLLRNRSNIWNVLFLFTLIFVAISIMTCLSVSAESIEDVWADAPTELKNPIKIGIFSLVAWGKMSTYIMINNVKFIFNFSTPADVIGVVDAIMAAVTAIGRMLCFLYFLLDLLEHATRDTFTVEAFVKSFAKLMILFVVFDPTNLQAITNFASALNNFVFAKISEGWGSGEAAELRALLNEMKRTSWIKCIGYILKADLMFPAVSVLISMIVALFIGIGRVIEIAVYRAMIPLGICSIYNGGVNSSGFRYLKKYVALELQGSIMFLALVVGSLVSKEIGSAVGGDLLGLLVDIAFSLATCAIIVRSKNIANDIVGV